MIFNVNFSVYRWQRICYFHQFITVNCCIVSNRFHVNANLTQLIRKLIAGQIHLVALLSSFWLSKVASKTAINCEWLQTSSSSLKQFHGSKIRSLLHTAAIILVMLQSPTTVFHRWLQHEEGKGETSATIRELGKQWLRQAWCYIKHKEWFPASSSSRTSF